MATGSAYGRWDRRWVWFWCCTVGLFVALVMLGISGRFEELALAVRQAVEPLLGMIVVVVATVPWLLAIPKVRAAKEQMS